MGKDWQFLKQMTQDQEVVVTRVEVKNSDIALEGKFELPPIAKLNEDDQVFIAAFIEVHGSIKEMERLFNISYPTVKARLRKITEKLKNFGLIAQRTEENNKSVLDRLANREITVEEALVRLGECSH